MSKLISMFCSAALSLVLTAPAFANTYHVTVDTSGWSGSGYLDFAVVGTPGAPGAVATISNLTGAFGAEVERVGAVSGNLPGGFQLANAAGDNYLTQSILFGGAFGFDIDIGGAWTSEEGSDGATFAIGLFDELFSQYTLAADFAAQPGNGVFAASLTPSAYLPAVSIVEVSAVPEPAAPLLVMTGLLVAWVASRRRPMTPTPRALHDAAQVFAVH